MNRMRLFPVFLLLVTATTSRGIDSTAAESQPNILIITADNLGYGDLPCYHPASPIRAPNLDR